MMRASIYLPEGLHQRLVLASRQKKRNVSEFVRDLLNQALATEETKQLDKMYATLKQMSGVIKDPIPDVSSTINETLYGEKGAWRGTMPDDEKK